MDDEQYKIRTLIYREMIRQAANLAELEQCQAMMYAFCHSERALAAPAEPAGGKRGNDSVVRSLPAVH